MRTERWVPGRPWGIPEAPTREPRDTLSPTRTVISPRYDTETFMPATGSMVTVRMPATDPANVTLPELGARTTVPTGA